jgi:hypothetical protein
VIVVLTFTVCDVGLHSPFVMLARVMVVAGTAFISKSSVTVAPSEVGTVFTPTVSPVVTIPAQTSLAVVVLLSAIVQAGEAVDPPEIVAVIGSNGAVGRT